MPHLDYRDPESLTEEERARLIDPWKDRFGYVSLWRQVLSHDPDTLSAWDDYYRRLLAGDIDVGLKELGFIVVAAVADCPYCVANHGEQFVEEHGYSMEQLEALVAGDYEGFDERERVVAELAETIARDPSAVSEEDVAALYDVGFDEAAVVELFVGLCTMLMASALMSGLGVSPDDAERNLSSYDPGSR